MEESPRMTNSTPTSQPDSIRDYLKSESGPFYDDSSATFQPDDTNDSAFGHFNRHVLARKKSAAAQADSMEEKNKIGDKERKADAVKSKTCDEERMIDEMDMLVKETMNGLLQETTAEETVVWTAWLAELGGKML
jgi:hypothetical protein